MGETARLIIAAILAPMFLVLLQGRQRRGERQESWARDDAKAARDAEVARLLVANNELVATATTRTHSEMAEIHTRVDDVHTLVDGGYTLVLQALVDALVEIQAMRVERRELRGDSEEQRTDAAVTDDRIGELRAQIAERTPPADQ